MDPENPETKLPAADPADDAGERLESLVNEYRGAVFAYARQLTRGDDGWAEDVLQETFLRAWQHSERLTPEYGSVRGWLMRVAHNLVMDGYRSARMRHDESLDVAGDIALPEPTGQILSVHVVRQALALLPEVHQRALEATYLKDQTTTQAARQLNVPVGTVKSRVFYGLRMLRSIMRVDLPSAA
ncbi:sigma-70 family RNA polymerase sigma factor [Pseudonocardia spinosispora]|uniref:sigma-70 family RNA polymerase sigma factor n=1 Tax=Pseudonocardia spinosispora TaxID=103441 RepID=UPI0007E8C418|nr:sigma-70 family RNA polymerase sigma factor [Pseudonocardia spinosispora]